MCGICMDLGDLYKWHITIVQIEVSLGGNEALRTGCR